MKITYKGDYALKVILELALNYNTPLITGSDLAKRIDAPIKFLEHVLSSLKKGGFIVSKRGKVGGYMLAKPPDKITVGDIVRYIDGPIEPIACINKGYDDCVHINKCVFQDIWQDVFTSISDIVDSITFEDLIHKVHTAKKTWTYSI